jgi:hypothetical protein
MTFEHAEDVRVLVDVRPERAAGGDARQRHSRAAALVEGQQLVPVDGFGAGALDDPPVSLAWIENGSHCLIVVR